MNATMLIPTTNSSVLHLNISVPASYLLIHTQPFFIWKFLPPFSINGQLKICFTCPYLIITAIFLKLFSPNSSQFPHPPNHHATALLSLPLQLPIQHSYHNCNSCLQTVLMNCHHTLSFQTTVVFFYQFNHFSQITLLLTLPHKS